MSADLDSVTVVASRFARSLAFYDGALAALGLRRVAEFGDEEEDDPEVEAAAWAASGGRTVLWLVTGPDVSAGGHVTLRTESRADVERFHAAAVAAGGSPRTEPRRWVIYRRGEFGASVADPDGNVVEVVAPE